MLPSLPVKKSVLRQLGIADNELPQGIARLKHNLVLSSSLTPSQNICTNSGLSFRNLGGGSLVEEQLAFQRRLYDTIAESPPIERYGPDCDKDCYASQKKIFKSMSYFDQIAIVCLASGVRACQAPDCLQHREKLERVVPMCDSWPGLRKWVLSIISCLLSAYRNAPASWSIPEDRPDETSKDGLTLDIGRHTTDEFIIRCVNHLTACIRLTIITAPGATEGFGRDPVGMSGSETRKGTGNESGSIDGPWPDQNIHSIEWASEREPNPRLPPVPRRDIYMQTFDPLQEGSAAGPSVDVAEVIQLIAWFRKITGDFQWRPLQYSATSVHDDDFIPVASKAITEASGKISRLGFCQQRVWEVVGHCEEGALELVPLVSALEHLPQLRHDKHKSCTSKDNHKSCTSKDDNKYCTPGEAHDSCTSGYCEFATQNFTTVTQLHKCPHPNDCATTPDEKFSQNLLVAALEDDTVTTAWTLDGMSLVPKGKSYLAVSHVWSNGTGVGAWKAGQVNKCLWDFFVEKARHLGCDGVWWDTVCIPQDKAARSIALNNMHRNYAAAEYTLVHDLYLAGIEWKSDGSPCIALVLSPWFTRGWTALELLLSKRVFVLFRQGNGDTLKDLDKEILAHHRILHSPAHWIATDAVVHLRNDRRTFNKGHYLLSVLGARYTSWSRDQSIIAGLMCGLTDHVALSEKDITKQILMKLRGISHNVLLHGLQTMPEPQLSWCPPRFIDIHSGTDPGKFSVYLRVKKDGTLSGSWKIWYIPSKSYIDRRMVWPLSTNMCVQTQVQWALQEPEKCLILTHDKFDSQGLLVRPKAYKDRPHKGLFCKYIGAVNLSLSGIQKPEFTESYIVIGYKPEMVDVGVVDCEQIIEQRLHYKRSKYFTY